MFLYALAKQVYNVFFPLQRPYCRICGRVREEYFVDDATWHAVTGGLDSLCFRHFVAIARSKGINYTWRVTPVKDWPQSQL